MLCSGHIPKQFMSEDAPNIPIEETDIDYAWRQAHKANQAYDELQSAQVTGRAYRALNAGSLDAEQLDTLSSNVTNAEAAFEYHKSLAAPLMSAPNSPFKLEIFDPMSDLDTDVRAMLKDLPAKYRLNVITQYQAIYAAVLRQQAEGAWPADLPPPELGALIESITALAPSYEIMSSHVWKPELVFIPRLTSEQWNNLFIGHVLGSGKRTHGICFDELRAYGINVERFTSLGGPSNPWEVAVISGHDRPALLEISADGQFPAVPYLLENLRDLPTVSSTPHAAITTNAEIVRRASPPPSAYFALQFSRLAGMAEPVDTYHATICRSLPGDGVAVSMSRGVVLSDMFTAFQFGWDLRHGHLDIELMHSNEPDPCCGIRPTVLGSDLESSKAE